VFTNQGISVDSWVQIEGHCSIEHEVTADEAQLTLGHHTGSLTLVASEQALEHLISVAAHALDQIRTTPTRTMLHGNHPSGDNPTPPS
jgi:hypothetical protein